MTSHAMHPPVADHFDDANQQRHAAQLGMWIFLASELLVFAVLFTGYAAARYWYPESFAQAGAHLYKWIGIANTAVLLLSSAAMAAAAESPPTAHRARAAWLTLTALLGTSFLIIKRYEYHLDLSEHLLPAIDFDPAPFDQPLHAQLFFIFYWVITSLHALHVLVGVVGIAFLAVQSDRGPTSSARHANTVHNIGLYWHFVDIVWLIILPLLYLNP